MSLADLRQEYARESLSERDVDRDPYKQFEKWFEQAQKSGMIEPNAMTLATATPDGRPSARMVLLKGISEKGLVFFTDYRSRKGTELDANPYAAVCFFWDALQRQVRVEGRVTRVSVDESTRYFRSRPRGSQMGAWASIQSAALAARDALEREVLRLIEKFPEGSEIPLPKHWGGYRLEPSAFEFWQGRPSRLHDRITYTRQGDAWVVGRLSP